MDILACEINCNSGAFGNRTHDQPVWFPVLGNLAQLCVSWRIYQVFKCSGNQDCGASFDFRHAPKASCPIYTATIVCQHRYTTVNPTIANLQTPQT